MPLNGGDSYDGFETLTERANLWMKEIDNIIHTSFQSILVQKGEGWHRSITEYKLNAFSNYYQQNFPSLN
jgi:hypothetical protein